MLSQHRVFLHDATGNSKPVIRLDRPVTVGDRPVTVGDRPVTVGDRPVTVVTAFYLIPSKFKEKDYVKWMSNFLPVIPCHLYVFTDQESYLQVKTQRSSFPQNITKYIVRPFSQLTEAKRLPMWSKQRKLDREKENHSPELYALWNEKVHLLMEAINDNPFDSDYFLWTDIGSFRNKEQAKNLSSFPDTHTTAALLGMDKVFFLQIGKFHQGHLQIGRNGLPVRDFQHNFGLAGTVFGGHSNALRKYEKRYYATMELMRRNGLFIGKDQNIMSTVAVLYPELVKLVRPQPYLGGADRWFYSHYYFSKRPLNETAE
ncbi:hypothetical protein BV898_10923 [Hypsibius exemplaris]|uniref:Uncharacterized protein n=1 Tax=Hypsibius exemplaris TaxID=2072580 RepID=A0A1W0WI53_HYPEX|nr:hypothetical protein BV898_10923 [Hypsibius exemplaris]